MYRVLINYNFYQDDLKYVSGGDQLQVSSKSDWREDGIGFLREAAQCDLVIFKGHGIWMSEFIEKFGTSAEAHAVWRNPNIKKVLWSEDSHHLWQEEKRLVPILDTVYTAHSEFVPNFEAENVTWLPCCFHWWGIDETIERLSSLPRDIRRSFVFPYNVYGLGDRNEVALKIKVIAEKLNLNNLMGFVGYADETAAAMTTSSFVLNVSLLSELNQRNFQGLLFDKVVLADKTGDHQKLGLDQGFPIVFFNRDLSDITTAISKALEYSGQTFSTKEFVLSGHMLTHRYLEIVNKELCLDLVLDFELAPATAASMNR